MQIIKKLLFGYYGTQCLSAAIQLKIADHLQSGAKSIAELSDLTQTNKEKLYRVMRYLAANQLFDELDDENFQLNENSSLLTEDNSANLHHYIKMHVDYFYFSATELANSLFQEKSAFELKFHNNAGKYFRDNPEAGEIYNQAMRENSELLGRLIVELYDFSNYQLIVDLGGNIGSLLATILLNNTEARGINFDLAELEQSSKNYFKQRKLSARCHFIARDFFQTIPEKADLYILKAILHAAPESQAITLLKKIKQCLSEDAKLLLIERVVDPTAENYLEACANDINMLNVTQGRVRSMDEYQHLLNEANLTLMKRIPLTDAISILECS